MLKEMLSSTHLRTYLYGDSGASAIEYGLIVGVVSIGAIVGFQILGTQISNEFSAAATTTGGVITSSINEANAAIGAPLIPVIGAEPEIVSTTASSAIEEPQTSLDTTPLAAPDGTATADGGATTTAEDGTATDN